MGDRPRSHVQDYEYSYDETPDERGKIRNITYSDLGNVKSRELALFRGRSDSQERQRYPSRSNVGRNNDNDNDNDRNNDNDDQEYYTRMRRSRYTRDDGNRDNYDDRQISRRRERNDNDQYALATRNNDQRIYDNRRREATASDSDSTTSTERRRRERRKHHHHRRRKDRSHSRHKPHRSKSNDNDKGQDSDKEEGEGGVTWFNGKPRHQASFFEKHFDSSYEGITAAIAGGLIGGMTARRFAGNEMDGGGQGKKGKMLAGAAVGAAGFNAAENWFRLFTEEKAERKEKKWEKEYGGQQGQGQQGKE